MRTEYRILIETPEGKRPLGRPRRRWEDILVALREIQWEGVGWTHLSQDKDQ
jgi:hypothetical protein